MIYYFLPNLTIDKRSHRTVFKKLDSLRFVRMKYYILVIACVLRKKNSITGSRSHLIAWIVHFITSYYTNLNRWTYSIHLQSLIVTVYYINRYAILTRDVFDEFSRVYTGQKHRSELRKDLCKQLISKGVI